MKGKQPMSIALAVVDTAEFNRIGIREIVSASDTVKLAGEFAQFEELYLCLKATPVDIVVLGHTQAYVHLVNNLKQLYQSYPHLKVLLMTNNFGIEQIEELTNLGSWVSSARMSKVIP